MKKRFLLSPGPGFFAVVVALVFFCAFGVSRAVEINMDVAAVSKSCSPWLYGGCLEDLNHQVYGGLYDQRLYGESFEEAVRPSGIAGWATYGGQWQPAGASISVPAANGAKLVKDQPLFSAGGVEFDLCFTAPVSAATRAGALIQVSSPTVGANAFAGYEVSLASDGSTLALARHQQNRAILKTVNVAVDASQWQHLRVSIAGTEIQIFLNGGATPAIDYVDSVALPAGGAGLVTYGADAQFRDFKTTSPEGITTADFQRAPSSVIGWLDYGGEWEPTGAGVVARANPNVMLVRQAPQMTDGELQCDVRFSTPASAATYAGIIVRGMNIGLGANQLDGYEVSLTSDGTSLQLSRPTQTGVLKTVPVVVDPSQWQHLRVAVAGAEVKVYLNNAAAATLDYVDSAPLGNGNVGVQTMNANAEFRNFTTTTGSTVITSTFVGIPAADVSGQWNPVQTGTALAAFGLDGSAPFNTSFSQRVQFISGTGTVGIANQGLNRWGIAVNKGSAYPGRVHLRTSGLAGAVIVSLQSADGSRIYASQSLTGVTAGWQKFPFTLIPNVTDPNARFVIELDAPGTLWIDEAVLTGSPDPEYPGVPVRPDIANAVKAGGLTFMRYGGSATNMAGYRWKRMIGDRDRRPMYEGNWHPNTSNGFAIEEFVAYCRVSGIEPAFAVNIEETPQDMADMVEYLNGAATTTWGAVRAANGHPDPYGVKYIELGNEEAIDPSLYDHYVDRFKLLATAMKAVDPALSLVIAAWWRPDEDCRRVFTQLEGLAAYWDFHIWIDGRYRGLGVDNELTQAQALFQQWIPGAKMKVVIFEENGVTHDLERALAHATILNAVRRHADFVLVDCEADALQAWCQNDNGWDQGHIFFTPDKVWGMPNYHLEKMAAENHLPLLVNSVVTGNPSLDVTVTKSLDGTTVCLHVVNLGTAASTATLNLANLNSINPVAEAWTISGNPGDVNTLDQPLAIQPVEHDIANAGNSFSYTFPGISYTVVRLTGLTGSSGVTGSPAAVRAMEYAMSRGLNGADAAATADPDADGLDNFSEWAFGTQPGVRDAAVASVGISITGSPVTGFRFSHRRLIDYAAAGVTYRYEVSPDMVNWHPVVPVPGPTTSLGSSFGYEMAEMDLPALEVAGRARLFLRISEPH